tara:strand:+ start:1164 stop:1406 length:243 start_codon:yes stop_codon:yes gene_type:complete
MKHRTDYEISPYEILCTLIFLALTAPDDEKSERVSHIAEVFAQRKCSDAEFRRAKRDAKKRYELANTLLHGLAGLASSDS